MQNHVACMLRAALFREGQDAVTTHNHEQAQRLARPTHINKCAKSPEARGGGEAGPKSIDMGFSVFFQHSIPNIFET